MAGVRSSASEGTFFVVEGFVALDEVGEVKEGLDNRSVKGEKRLRSKRGVREAREEQSSEFSNEQRFQRPGSAEAVCAKREEVAKSNARHCTYV